MDQPATASGCPTDADRITPAGRFEPLVLAGHVYLAMVDSWMHDERPWLNEWRRSSRALRRSSSPPAEVAADGKELHDALDVVLWDRTLIPAKLARAMSGGREGHSASDVNGSAKVALLSMDRSLAAWQTLRSHRRGQSGSVSSLLAYLAELRTATEARFPDARAFKRPGFDEVGDWPRAGAGPGGHRIRRSGRGAR